MTAHLLLLAHIMIWGPLATIVLIVFTLLRMRSMQENPLEISPTR